jgi:hypothetical protein
MVDIDPVLQLTNTSPKQLQNNHAESFRNLTLTRSKTNSQRPDSTFHWSQNLTIPEKLSHAVTVTRLCMSLTLTTIPRTTSPPPQELPSLTQKCSQRPTSGQETKQKESSTHLKTYNSDQWKVNLDSLKTLTSPRKPWTLCALGTQWTDNTGMAQAGAQNRTSTLIRCVLPTD